jgi:hypothetical protein
MTEAAWPAYTEPESMLEYLGVGGVASERMLGSGEICRG